ncbi:MAG TPA: transcription antitermination factor NusB [Streptosporangiaceae bacterium]|nr:transcription antitermination factor NusB [Streptosporangiaceae bacterium]
MSGTSDGSRRRSRPSAARGGGRDRRASAGQRARDPARRVALDVLLAVEARDAYANLLLPQLISQQGLTGRDAALATELSYGTLRGRGSYDAVLGICCDRDLGSLDPPVREVLRLGTHQLLATRIQPHAAVATSVDLVKDVAGPRPAGFVNAVLRRVATRDLDAWLDVAAPDRDGDPVGHLAVRYSHPRWIVEAFAAALGEEPGGQLPQTEALLAADGERPAVHLCAVPGIATQQELVAAGCEPARWSAFGAYLSEGDPAAVTAVAAGRAGVQDEASQLAAAALTRVAADGPDRRWLDICAGPGGKARLLAGLAAGAGAHLTAAEFREHRAGLVRSAVEPAGPTGVIVADGTRPAWQPARFDRVIADVPCSGLGALRRRPEARWRRSPADVGTIGGLQRALLRAALDSARLGGVVAYVTCSPHLAETRDVVADVLDERADVDVLDAPAVLAEVPDLRCADDSRYAQFWPHRHGTDAIFLALLRRRRTGA